jgi:outer membrane protein OmpA-like peptidoglycan-associated protein/tetratricopeptide (TPR) repeat protein
MKKKMKRNYIIAGFMLILLVSNLTFAQNVEFTKYNFPSNKSELSDALSYISTGDKYYDEGPGLWRLAIDNYLKAYKFNPENSLLNYKLGRCYLNNNDKAEAIKYLEKAIRLDPRISLDMTYNDANFLLARAYHLDYQFDKAIAKYKDHKNALTPEQLAADEKKINKMIGECETAKELVAHPVRVFVDNLGEVVNSAYPDYRPLVVPEESLIMFTSSRENTTGGKRDKDSYYFEDIYASYYEDGRWTQPENSYDLNSNNHDATAGISSDGTILFIYKSSGGNHLYESNLAGNMYTLPAEMPGIINDGLKQASASLTFDKTTLYFTSQREDGYGGQDIYFSKRDAKDRWQKPENLGATINTPYDEEGVFITPDGKTLYFSSTGHNCMGGFDIFKSEFKDNKWSNPENLGYPVNTPDNDVFFTMASSGQRGYYSSKKKDGFGEQDLYIITFLGAAKPMISNGDQTLLSFKSPSAVPKPAPAIEQNTVLTGHILDSEDLSPIQATIEIIDNSKNELMASFESNATNGAYLISLQPGKNYGISVNRKEYLFHSENFDIPEDAMAKKISKDILLKRLEVGSKIILNNIFFDFNKATLRSESVAELDRVFKMLNDLPTLKIELSGHTDNVGSASYNQKLSEDRAKSVVDYLIGKGIAVNRLVFKGYGFSQPIADNKTEEGRQQNRRTEFKVLEK